MYLPMEQGGLVVPDVLRYYDAVQLTNMLQWWRKEQGTYRGHEQLEVHIPLADWIQFGKGTSYNLVGKNKV